MVIFAFLIAEGSWLLIHIEDLQKVNATNITRGE